MLSKVSKVGKVWICYVYLTSPCTVTCFVFSEDVKSTDENSIR